MQINHTHFDIRVVVHVMLVDISVPFWSVIVNNGPFAYFRLWFYNCAFHKSYFSL